MDVLLTWLPVVGALVLLICAICGAVTAAKGRWVWFVAGFLTFGLIWLHSARLSATPDSLWYRVITRRRLPAAR